MRPQARQPTPQDRRSDTSSSRLVTESSRGSRHSQRRSAHKGSQRFSIPLVCRKAWHSTPQHCKLKTSKTPKVSESARGSPLPASSLKVPPKILHGTRASQWRQLAPKKRMMERTRRFDQSRVTTCAATPHRPLVDGGWLSKKKNDGDVNSCFAFSCVLLLFPLFFRHLTFSWRNDELVRPASALS